RRCGDPVGRADLAGAVRLGHRPGGLAGDPALTGGPELGRGPGRRTATSSTRQCFFDLLGEGLCRAGALAQAFWAWAASLCALVAFRPAALEAPFAECWASVTAELAEEIASSMDLSDGIPLGL